MTKKSSKRRRERDEDFKKPKLKVGKKKARPDNFTDTTFRSRAVQLPSQSILVDKTAVPVNARNQTVQELVSLVRHPSAATRKDAVFGIRDLLTRNPYVLHQSAAVSTLWTATARLIVDEDSSVRTHLHTLFTSFPPTLAFLPLFLVYTTSALNHILPEIRADAVKFMEVWCGIAPNIVRSHALKIVPSYVAMLKGSMTNAKEVLVGLYRILEVGIGNEEGAKVMDPFWYFANFVEGDWARHEVRHGGKREDDRATIIEWGVKRAVVPVHPSTMPLLPYLEPSSPSLQLLSITTATASKDPSASEDDIYVKNLLATLHPLLLSIWLDTAPAMFATVSAVHPGPALTTVQLVLKVLGVLWRAALTGETAPKMSHDKAWLDEQLQPLLRHVLVYFPFGREVRDSKSEAVLQEMNARFCEVTALFLLASSGEQQTPVWAERVVEYVLGILGSGSVDGLAVDFRPKNLVALLPSVWVLLNCLGEEGKEQVFEALLAYDKRCHAQSTAKRICLEFISRAYTLQLQPCYIGGFKITASSRLAQMLHGWIEGLPRLLGEIRTSSPETTDTVLTLLCQIARQGGKSAFDDTLLESLETSMLAFFHVVTPRSGPMFGPFVTLPGELQRRAIEFLFYTRVLPDKMQHAVEACLADGLLSPATRQYLRHVLRHRELAGR